MKNLFYTLILILSLFTCSVSFAQQINLDGFGIELELHSPRGSALDYQLNRGVLGINLFKRVATTSNEQFEFYLGVGYVKYKPKSVRFSAMAHPFYEFGDNLWSDSHSYNLTSIPIKLTTSFNTKTIKLSAILGVAIKTLEETTESYENFNTTQYITEDNYTSFLSGLQIDFPIYKSFTGFLRIERHENSVLFYSEQALGNFEIPSDYLDDGYEQIKMTNANDASVFSVIGIKFSFSSD